MTHNSRKPLRTSTREKLFHIFYELLGSQKSESQFTNLISELFTPAEQIMFAKRIAILYLIQKRIDHATIRSVLHVSMSSISRYILLLENSEHLAPKLQTMANVDSLKLFFEQLISELLPPGAPMVNWGSAWKRKNRIAIEKKEGL